MGLDDLSYLRTAFLFAQTGHFVYNGWTTAMLGAQIVWAAPVAGSLAALLLPVAWKHMSKLQHRIHAPLAVASVDRFGLSTNLAIAADGEHPPVSVVSVSRWGKNRRFIRGGKLVASTSMHLEEGLGR